MNIQYQNQLTQVIKDYIHDVSLYSNLIVNKTNYKKDIYISTLCNKMTMRRLRTILLEDESGKNLFKQIKNDIQISIEDYLKPNYVDITSRLTSVSSLEQVSYSLIFAEDDFISFHFMINAQPYILIHMEDKIIEIIYPDSILNLKKENLELQYKLQQIQDSINIQIEKTNLNDISQVKDYMSYSLSKKRYLKKINKTLKTLTDTQNQLRKRIQKNVSEIQIYEDSKEFKDKIYLKDKLNSLLF